MDARVPVCSDDGKREQLLPPVPTDAKHALFPMPIVAVALFVANGRAVRFWRTAQPLDVQKADVAVDKLALLARLAHVELRARTAKRCVRVHVRVDCVFLRARHGERGVPLRRGTIRKR